LKARAKTKQAQRNWPGPIAFYLLDKVNADTMLAETISKGNVIEHKDIAAQFYIAARKLDAGDKVGYREEVSEIASRTIPKAIIEEYLLARHEYTKINGANLV